MANKLLTGLIVGVGVPIVAAALLMILNTEVFGNLELKGGAAFSLKESTIVVLAICFNLIPFQIFRRRFWDNSMNGVVFVTFFWVILFFIWYFFYPQFTLHLSG